MLGFDPLAIFGVDHRHPGGAPKDLGQHALAVVGQMCKDDKCQPVIGWHGSEKLLQRLDSSCRGADTDDRKSRRHCLSLPVVTLTLLLANGLSAGASRVARKSPRERR